MVKLHKLNGTEIVINAELIESLESGGGQETVVALATGNRYLVTETPDEVTQKVLEYRAKVNAGPKVVNPIQGYKREQS
ncbi:MAG: flagellar FlbD family protein [Elusimicrobiota bacterium]